MGRNHPLGAHRLIYTLDVSRSRKKATHGVTNMEQALWMLDMYVGAAWFSREGQAVSKSSDSVVVMQI